MPPEQEISDRGIPKYPGEIKFCLLCPAIKLDKGYRTLVDPEDYVKINRKGWRIKRGKGGIYAIKYFKHHGRFSGKYLHRVIMDSPKNMVVHHKNGFTLDNRKDNLQIMRKEEHQIYETQKRITKRVGGKSRLKDQRI